MCCAPKHVSIVLRSAVRGQSTGASSLLKESASSANAERSGCADAAHEEPKDCSTDRSRPAATFLGNNGGSVKRQSQPKQLAASEACLRCTHPSNWKQWNGTEQQHRDAHHTPHTLHPRGTATRYTVAPRDASWHRPALRHSCEHWCTRTRARPGVPARAFPRPSVGLLAIDATLSRHRCDPVFARRSTRAATRGRS